MLAFCWWAWGCVYLACVCALPLRVCVLPMRVCVLAVHVCGIVLTFRLNSSGGLRFVQQWGSKVCAQVIHSSPVCSPLLWVGVGVSTVWEGGEGEEHCLLGASDSDSDAFEQWFILFCV